MSGITTQLRDQRAQALCLLMGRSPPTGSSTPCVLPCFHLILSPRLLLLFFPSDMLFPFPSALSFCNPPCLFLSFASLVLSISLNTLLTFIPPPPHFSLSFFFALSLSCACFEHTRTRTWVSWGAGGFLYNVIENSHFACSYYGEKKKRGMGARTSN